MSELLTCDCRTVAIPDGFGPLNATGATKGVRVVTWPPRAIVRRRWLPSRVVQGAAYYVWHHPSGCGNGTTPLLAEEPK